MKVEIIYPTMPDANVSPLKPNKSALEDFLNDFHFKLEHPFHKSPAQINIISYIELTMSVAVIDLKYRLLLHFLAQPVHHQHY